jgi:hypothetical protein
MPHFWPRIGACPDSKSRKHCDSRDIDPIIEKTRKNSLDRELAQASEFPVINAEGKSAF